TSTSSLTSILHPKVTQTFNANGHLTVKTVTPEDTSPAGLQAGKQSQRYTYSVSERLLRISDGSGVANTANNANNEQGNEIARYAYDPFGRRIKKTVSQNPTGQGSPGTTLYFYADEGLTAEVDGNAGSTTLGNITTTYGWVPASANKGRRAGVGALCRGGQATGSCAQARKGIEARRHSDVSSSAHWE
ncbi:MAG: hypothetical protein ING71_15670, partial [Rhodocyclaceae bacterium]|nr:hypothetical protein [Rhodocyclaceae bacterium]